MEFKINAYGDGEEPTNYDSVLECLKNERVVSFEIAENGLCEVKEQCDDYFGGYLDKEQVLKLSDELKELAEKM